MSNGKDKIKFAESYYGMQNDFDNLYKLSKENKDIKNLMELISKPENLKLAYRNIKANKGSKTPGIDKKIIKDIEEMSERDFVKHFQNRLKNFNPMPVRRVFIPKSNGKLRPLGIPTISDRIIQQSIKQVMEPICEAKFHKHSYGFRPNRNASHALFRIQHLINNSQLHYCVDLDIKSFFDEVNHGKLLKQIWSMGIKDKRLISILSRMLKFEVNGIVQEKGTPQGGIISPLLANIVLNEFDWWISSQYETMKLRDSEKYNSKSWHFRTLKNKTNLKEMYVVRYADDVKIICRDYVTAVKILEASKKWLKERLNLTVSNEKTKIVNLRKNYSDFLGIRIRAQKKKKKISATSRISKDRVKKIKEEIRNSINKIKKYQDARSAYNYNLIVMGIHNYYNKATNVFKDMKDINYRMIPVLRNALWKFGKYGYHESDIESFNERYFKKRSYKTWMVEDIPLIPICDVQYKTNLAFKQSICNYTKTGRKELKYETLYLKYEIQRIQNETLNNENIKLHDNKISKFSMQNGLCCISKIFLSEGSREVHHKKPRALGGSDSYTNICWVNNKIHKLIHITNKELIKDYLNEIINISEVSEEKLIKRINKFRKLAMNEPITL